MIKIKKFYNLKYIFFFLLTFVQSKNVSGFSLNIDSESITGQTDPALQLLFLVTIITLLPTLLLMLTSFTRIIIVLHFIRSALATQQMPPNQVLIGLALFLTFFIMGPVFEEINENAIVPYSNGELSQSEAVEIGLEPIRDFMINQTEEADIALFAKFDGAGAYDTVDDIPFRVLAPAFILGEITKGFVFGFVVYMPFLVIDMVVASTLMAMGMMMLPPGMISLPFKILFFVIVDGWSLLLDNLVKTFVF